MGKLTWMIILLMVLWIPILMVPVTQDIKLGHLVDMVGMEDIEMAPVNSIMWMIQTASVGVLLFFLFVWMIPVVVGVITYRAVRKRRG